MTSFTWLSEERGFSQGFDYWKPVFDQAHPEREVTGPYALKAALGVWKELEKDPHPIFLWVHLFDAHERYIATRGGRLREEQNGTLRRRDRVRRQAPRRADERRRASPRASKVTWIVHGSQGEGLNEHDFTGHGGELYEEVLRVPLVISSAETRPARYSAGPVSTLDLAATVVELAGAEAEGLAGVSLLPVVRGELQHPHGPVYARSQRRVAVIDWPLKLMVIEERKRRPRAPLRSREGPGRERRPLEIPPRRPRAPRKARASFEAK